MFEERRNAKRTAQRMLFEALTSKPSKVLGLAGDCPDKYKQVLEETIHPSKILLCDKHRYGGEVVRGNIATLQYMVKAPMVDCDFCNSIVNAKDSFLDVFNTLNTLETNERRALSFTFSLRCAGGIERMFDFLNQHLYQGTLQVAGKSRLFGGRWGEPYLVEYRHSQSKFIDSKLISYRDTTCMFSGIISW